MGKTFKNISKYGVDDAVGFGKYLGLGNTWGKIAESDPEYVFWVVANTDKPLGRDVLVLAIKAQQLAKAARIAAKKNAVDYDRAEYIPETYHPQSDTFKRKKTPNFYDGGLRGDMAHFTATQQQDALDAIATTMFGDDWDDDVPF